MYGLCMYMPTYGNNVNCMIGTLRSNGSGKNSPPDSESQAADGIWFWKNHAGILLAIEICWIV